jgi:hypothetical protein
MRKIAVTAARPRLAAPIEEWVHSRTGQDDERAPEAAPTLTEPTIRLTLDIQKRMHKRLKQGALDREQTIADVIRALVAREFPAS